MSDGSTASYYFLPWVRFGLLRDTKDSPELGKNNLSAHSLSGRLKININVLLKQESTGIHNQENISKDFSVFGPGDIVGIDQREVVRTEPRHLTNDFPPNLFPFIEFNQPDFPWLFTPGKPDNDECLRPWLVLVVLSKQDWEIITDPSRPLPYLKFIGSSGEISEELSNLDESWAWAHAQYVGMHNLTDSSVADALTDTKLSYQNLSRLICPRSLKINERYIACVVPAFEAGRKAGLGETDIGSDLKPAWDQSDKNKLSELKLPVYYHWEFHTRAEKEDFEEFIDQLKLTREVKFPSDSSRLMKIMQPVTSPQAETIEIPVPSALLSNPKIPEIPKNFKESFWKFIKTTQPDNVNSSATNSQLPLPIYGSWHSLNNFSENISLSDGDLPQWLITLNSDPRYRVAAALGTQVIQRQQEQLMAAAWEKASGIKEVNQWFKQKQLARDVTQSIFSKRLNILSEDALEQITAPLDQYQKTSLATPEIEPLSMAQSARPAAFKKSITRSKMATVESRLSQAFVSASFRRISRLSTRFASKSKFTAEQARQTQTKELHIETAQEGATGGLLARIRSGQITSTPVPGKTAKASPPIDQNNLTTKPLSEVPQRASVAPKTGAQRSREDLLKMIDPYITFNNEVRNRVVTPEKPIEDFAFPKKAADITSGGTDPIRPHAYDALEFKQPMYEPLRDLFQNMLIPGGIDQIPNNSIIVLEANAAFIEAYMVGLNHEMSRELLWREYPAKLNKTFFKQFWDVRGSSKPVEDIQKEISEWDKQLGENMEPNRGKNLFILMIKSNLLLRYPNTIISARKAVWNKNGDEIVSGDLEQFPSFRINPVPGVTMMGFDLGDHSAFNEKITANNLGWFFVIEEHPTEIRFGLDLSNDGLTSWHELAWSDVSNLEGGCISVQKNNPNLIQPKTSLPANINPNNLPAPNDPQWGDFLIKNPDWKRYLHDKTKIWGKNSAHMAYILLQKAYRIQIHSSTWFPDTAN